MSKDEGTIAEKILAGDHTNSPWGNIETDCIEEFGPGLVGFHTPSHGGLRIDEPALSQVPKAVRGCLRNGPNWAEEDVEMAIVLAMFIPERQQEISQHLPMAGRNSEDGDNALVAYARKAAARYDSYNPCLKHLPNAAGPRQQDLS